MNKHYKALRCLRAFFYCLKNNFNEIMGDEFNFIKVG